MPNDILIIDDDPDDLTLLEMTLRRKGVANPIRFLPQAEVAIDYFSGNGPYADRKLHPLPSLIFLDLRLPQKSGHALLEWVNAHREIPRPKVVIYTQSTEVGEVERARLLGADAVLIKDTLEEQLSWILLQFPDVWEFLDAKGPGMVE